MTTFHCYCKNLGSGNPAEKPSKNGLDTITRRARRDLDNKNSFESKGKNFDVYYWKYHTTVQRDS
jgi:hypothetical protein